MKKSLFTFTAFAMIFLLVIATAAACGNGKGGSTAQDSYVPMTTSAELGADFYNSAVMSDGMYYTEGTFAETAAAALEITEEEWDADSVDAGYSNGLSALPDELTTGEASDSPDADDSAAAKSARKLIRTVNLNVETTEFDDLLASIKQFVNTSGGYIEQSDLSGRSISGGNGRRYASITARIPAGQVDAFLSRMDEKSNVTYRSENVQDVTLQYTDIESRKKSLTIEQERLWELLEKADSLDAVIALEERLSEIRYELEKFESRLRTYDNQVDYSTVYISIDEVAVFTPTEPDSVMTRIQKGFSRNVENVENGFINGFVWFVSSLPTLAVWAVFIAVIAVILRIVIKRFRRRRVRTSARLQQPDMTQSSVQIQAQPQPLEASPQTWTQPAEADPSVTDIRETDSDSSAPRL